MLYRSPDSNPACRINSRSNSILLLQVPELLHGLAQRGVDLRSIGLTSIDGQTTAVLTTSDDLITHEELVHCGATFTEGDVVFISVPDEPGALADVAGRFLKADLVVHGILLLRWYQGRLSLPSRWTIRILPARSWRHPSTSGSSHELKLSQA